MKTKRIDDLFYFVPILLLVNLVMRWELTRIWSYDTVTYILFADKLPIIEDSVFPIFYPLCLKFINLIFNDYVLSYKTISLVSLAISLFFVRWKDFYWREIWTLLTFYSFLRMPPWGWSELIIIPLILVVIYYNHQFLYDKISGNTFIVYNSALLFLCFFTKYNSLFHIVAFGGFSIFLFLIKDKKARAYFISSILVLGASFIYLMINYFLTGEMMGRRQPPDSLDIRSSFSQVIFNLNPFFHTKGSFLGFYLGLGIAYLSGVVFFLLYIMLIFRALEKNILIERFRIKKITGGGKFVDFVYFMFFFIFGRNNIFVFLYKN